jgi:hypothetical protein
MIKNIQLLLTFLLLLLLFESTLGQSTWTTPINLSSSPDWDIFNYGYSTFIDRNGTIYVAWSEVKRFPNIGYIVLRKSTDDGLSWSKPEIITDTVGAYWSPRIAVDSENNIHLMYWGILEYRFFYQNYNGSSWSEPYAISPPGSQIGTLAIDKENVIHFFWGYLGDYIFISHRTIHNGVWSDPEVITSFRDDAGSPYPIIDDANKLHVVYAVNLNIAYRKLDENGWTEEEKITDDTLRNEDQRLILTNNKLLSVWSRYITPPGSLIINWSIKDETSAWSPPVPVSDLSRSNHIGICNDENEVVHMIFSQIYRPGPFIVKQYYTKYNNNFWTTPELINLNVPNPHYMNTLMAKRNKLLLFFTADEPNLDLYFTSSPIITSDVEEEIQSDVKSQLSVYPNPFNSEAVIKYSLTKTGRAKIKMFDLLGREVKTMLDEEKPAGSYQLSFKGNDIASGIYFCTLLTPHEYIVEKISIIK